jgi:hypothetical protein
MTRETRRACLDLQAQCPKLDPKLIGLLANWTTAAAEVFDRIHSDPSMEGKQLNEAGMKEVLSQTLDFALEKCRQNES